jgi:hypothetical protein
MYLLSRTVQAFQWTVEQMFERNEHVFFWTFTFKNVPPTDDYAMEQYNLFKIRLCSNFKWIQGVRVCELHRSHGIHFHLLLNDRVPLDRMERIIRGTGFLAGQNHYLDFGRLSVAKCDKGTALYLSKYMTKEYRIDNFFGRRRRWGTIGGLPKVACRDIVYDTPTSRNRYKIFGQFPCGYGALLMITHYSNLWGDLDKWPQECQALVRLQKDNRHGEWIKHVDPDGRAFRAWRRNHGIDDDVVNDAKAFFERNEPF